MPVFRDAKPRVLIVDDEEPVRILLSDFLASRGFDTAQAGDANEALAALEQQACDLVVSDVNMPGRNGISLLNDIRRKYPSVAVLMLTGCGDVSTAVDSMKGGALDYLLKPFGLNRLEGAVQQALERHAAIRQQAEHLRRLEETVTRQTGELRDLLGHLNEASESTLEALVAALDAREHETKAHSRRVAEYTVRLAETFSIGASELKNIRRGAMLHDIGKIGISDNILLKPGPLTDAEWEEMRRHPQIGHWIIRGIESLRGAEDIVLAHHERFDGSGYPNHLKAGQIPLGARIFAVADSLDAMTSDRPYQRGQSFEAARDEIAAHAGAQFDPEVVEHFLSLPMRVWREICESTLRENTHPLEISSNWFWKHAG